jgi:hypothetical protein
VSITDTNKIDIIAARPKTSLVSLVIADHLPWDDLEAHSMLLQDKINTYLEFVESGQLARMKTPEIPTAPEIHFTLSVQFRPPAGAQEFLAKVREFLAQQGIHFDVDDSRARD